MKKEKVLIVGGYGVVGEQIAEILRNRNPDLILILGGRHPEKADQLIQKLGNAYSVRVDNTRSHPLRDIDPDLSLVINAVNDPEDYLLQSAVQLSIPFIDITRWSERFLRAQEKINQFHLQAPVILSSGWMAGVAALFAKIGAMSFEKVDQIDINVLFSLSDKAGPNSTEYIDRLTIPFDIIENYRPRSVSPLTDPLPVRFPNGYKIKCYRLDTPDHITVPVSTEAASVNFRIAFDHKFVTYSLRLLVMLGIWKLISGERFTKLRQRLLYSPGNGGDHQIVIHYHGTDKNQRKKQVQKTITDPLGQTHLTALGAVFQAEHVLEQTKSNGLSPRIYYPEDVFQFIPHPSTVLQFFQEHGVVISEK